MLYRAVCLYSSRHIAPTCKLLVNNTRKQGCRMLSTSQPPEDSHGDVAKIKINKRLAMSGLCSRREADNYVLRGLVCVEGRIAKAGERVAHDSLVTLLPEAISEQCSKMTLLLHKPEKWVSQNPGAKNTGELGPPCIRLLTKQRCFAGWEHFLRCRDGAVHEPAMMAGMSCVGRLDLESTGLIIFSQDGNVVRHVLGQHGRIEKQYLVDVERDESWFDAKQHQTITCDQIHAPLHQELQQPSMVRPTRVSSHDWVQAPWKGKGQDFQSDEYDKWALSTLHNGIFMDFRKLQPCKVSVVAGSLRGEQATLDITLTEGRNKQIRRMCSLVGLKVRRIHRIRIGPWMLDDLPVGMWRALPPEQVNQQVKQ